MTRNLNKIIDINYYPVETARRSNMRHRPIGLGVQGLADAFILLGLPFDSQEVSISHIVICIPMQKSTYHACICCVLNRAQLSLLHT